MGKVKIKSNTNGMGPLGILMGRHSVQAEGKHGTGYGWTKKQAIDDYNQKSSGKKR